MDPQINSWNHTFHIISLEGHWIRPNGFRWSLVWWQWLQKCKILDLEKIVLSNPHGIPHSPFKRLLRDPVRGTWRDLRSRFVELCNPFGPFEMCVILWIHRCFLRFVIRANLFSFTDFLPKIFTSPGSLWCCLSNQGCYFEFYFFKNLSNPL